jgi:hypothetical protein
MQNEHEDFEVVERRLRDARPEATDAALNRARLMAAPADAPAPRRARTSARGRTRVAIAGLLASGLLMSGGGAALGISGINSNGSAGAAQYVSNTTGTNEVLGTTSTVPTVTEPGSGGTTKTPTEPGSSGVLGETVQPSRQVAAASSEKELPFTGLAAIPVIMAGVALLGAGLVIRSRSSRTTT